MDYENRKELRGATIMENPEVVAYMPPENLWRKEPTMQFTSAVIDMRQRIEAEMQRTNNNVLNCTGVVARRLENGVITFSHVCNSMEGGLTEEAAILKDGLIFTTGQHTGTRRRDNNNPLSRRVVEFADQKEQVSVARSRYTVPQHTEFSRSFSWFEVNGVGPERSNWRVDSVCTLGIYKFINTRRVVICRSPELRSLPMIAYSYHHGWMAQGTARHLGNRVVRKKPEHYYEVLDFINMIEAAAPAGEKSRAIFRWKKSPMNEQSKDLGQVRVEDLELMPTDAHLQYRQYNSGQMISAYELRKHMDTGFDEYVERNWREVQL